MAHRLAFCEEQGYSKVQDFAEAEDVNLEGLLTTGG